MAVAGAVIIVIALISFTILSKSALPRGVVTPPVGVQVQGSFPEILRVSLSDAKKAFDSGNAVFVDVRPADSYAQSHVPGALNIPINLINSRLGELKTTAWIIPYCT